MRICVVGAGAIGGFIGAQLALSGEDVTLIDRGAHLAEMKRNGLRLLMKDGTECVVKDAVMTDNFRQHPRQDVVILGVKSHEIESVAEQLPFLLSPDTVVVTPQNGIPWWYFQKHAGTLQEYQFKSLDPNGVISANIAPDRIIGCVAYPAAEVLSPGVIRQVEGHRLPVGELDGTESERARNIANAFVKAGFKSPILTDIRSELWLKLWGTLAFNPISALTHSTLVDICRYPLTKQLVEAMMAEAQLIAHKLGIEFRLPMEKRIAGAEKVGQHKTSMLQDVEHGKTLEINALVGALVELGALTNTPVPCINAVFACVKLLDKTIRENHLLLKANAL